MLLIQLSRLDILIIAIIEQQRMNYELSILFMIRLNVWHVTLVLVIDVIVKIEHNALAAMVTFDCSLHGQ